MALILLSEYGEHNNKCKAAVLRMANRGSFQTARKIGRQWFIDEDEPYPDLRVKDGKYIGMRKKSTNRNEPKK